jgi:hypothetical protein
MNDLISFITNAAPSVILVLTLNGFGLAIKKVPYVPDWLIPLILPVAGALIYPFVGEYSPVVLKAQIPTLLMGLYGFGLGWVAVGANQFWRQMIGRFLNGHATLPSSSNDPTD